VASSKAQAIDQLTKPNIYDVLYAKETKKPTAAKETKAQVNQTMENKEYCFEEMENSRIEKNKVKNGQKTHSKSKSTSIHISLVPMTKEKPKKFEAKTMNTNPEGRGRSRDVSINTVNISKEESKFFPESSKKLELLDNSMEKNHKFKLVNNFERS